MMRRPACSIMRRPAVAEPTAVRPGAEWLPDRARQAQSHRRGANANRAVAVRRSRQPPAVSRTAVQPSAVSSQSPSLPPPQQQRASSCVALPTQCGRAPPSGERACSELGRRARGRTAPVNRQPAPPTRSKSGEVRLAEQNCHWEQHLEHLECSYQPHIQGRGAEKRTQRAG